MAKKHFSKFVALAAVAGAAAAGVSYFLRYKSFHKELEEDFHDFEDEDEDPFPAEEEDSECVKRNYVSLNPDNHDKSEDSPLEESSVEENEDTPEPADELPPAESTTIVEEDTV